MTDKVARAGLDANNEPWVPNWSFVTARRVSVVLGEAKTNQVAWSLAASLLSEDDHHMLVVIGLLDHAAEELRVRVANAVVSRFLTKKIAEGLRNDDVAHAVAIHSASGLLYSHATTTARAAAALVSQPYEPSPMPPTKWLGLEVDDEEVAPPGR